MVTKKTYTTKRDLECPLKGEIDWDDELKRNFEKIDDASHFRFLQYPIITDALIIAGTGLALDTYYYKVTAYNAIGETLPSNEETVIISASGSQNIYLVWRAVTGATGYKVYRSIVSDAEVLLKDVGNVLTYTDNGTDSPGVATPPATNGAYTRALSQTNDVDDDTTEADTLDTLGATSGLINNLNRIRNVLKSIIGGASWLTAVTNKTLTDLFAKFHDTTGHDHSATANNAPKISTGGLADDAVDKDKIAADVAGDALGQNVDGSLEVKTDDSTIEKSGDAIQVKDNGITGDKIADGFTLTPASAVIAATIDQNNDETGLDIDQSAAAGSDKFGQRITNTSIGIGLFLNQIGVLAASKPSLYVYSNAALVNSDGNLVTFRIENASTTQSALRIINAGSGNDVVAPSFSLKNGYIAPGNYEAMRWDVIEFDINQASPESVGYSMDSLLCMGISVIGYDLSADTIDKTTIIADVHRTKVSYDGTDIKVEYGSAYVYGDDLRVILYHKSS